MKISFHIDSSLPAQAGELIERRCCFAFSRFSSIIDDVFVNLTDENGPRGGESMHCVVRVQMHRRPDVIIHEQADIWERALGLAIERAGHQVSRRNSRRTQATQSLRRNSLRRLAEAIPA